MKNNILENISKRFHEHSINSHKKLLSDSTSTEYISYEDAVHIVEEELDGLDLFLNLQTLIEKKHLYTIQQGKIVPVYTNSITLEITSKYSLRPGAIAYRANGYVFFPDYIGLYMFYEKEKAVRAFSKPYEHMSLDQVVEFAVFANMQCNEIRILHENGTEILLVDAKKELFSKKDHDGRSRLCSLDDLQREYENEPVFRMNPLLEDKLDMNIFS